MDNFCPVDQECQVQRTYEISYASDTRTLVQPNPEKVLRLTPVEVRTICIDSVLTESPIKTRSKFRERHHLFPDRAPSSWHSKGPQIQISLLSAVPD